MRRKKRISKRDIVALTKEYEKRVKKEDREKVLFSLSKKHKRSTRQIERYIQQGRKEIGTEEKGKVPPTVVVGNEKARLKAAHNEDIRKAIEVWIDKQCLASLEDLSSLKDGKLDAWGVKTKLVSSAQGQVMLTMASHPLYDSLRAHLVPLVVEESFWNKAFEIRDKALEFVKRGVEVFQAIERTAIQETGLAVTADVWQSEPVIGLTSAFTKTAFNRCLDIQDFTNWAYHAWAIVWPAIGGVIITWVNEGLRLLKGMGYDPRIALTTWQLTGQPVILPRGPNERIAYGNAALTGQVSIAFMLCFGSEEIAIAYNLEQLAVCEQAHKAIMQGCMSWNEAIALRERRERLDNLSNEILAQLEKARYSPSFPGKCSFCP